jgi:hypothetical protein
MPRSLPSPKIVPWAILLELATVARDHWHSLSERERTRISSLVRKSKGNPQNLTKKERDDLRRIVGKLDFGAIGKDLIPFVGQARRARRR